MHRLVSKNALVGILFLSISVLAYLGARNLEIGSMRQTDSGFFPMLLSGLLFVIGFAIVAGEAAGMMMHSGERPRFSRADMRACLFVLAATLLFAVGARTIGLAATSFLTICVAALAGRPFHPVQTLALAAGMTAFVVAAFHYGLGLPIPLWFPL